VIWAISRYWSVSHFVAYFRVIARWKSVAEFLDCAKTVQWSGITVGCYITLPPAPSRFSPMHCYANRLYKNGRFLSITAKNCKNDFLFFRLHTPNCKQEPQGGKFAPLAVILTIPPINPPPQRQKAP